MNLTRTQLYLSLGLVILAVVLWSAHESVGNMERKAGIREREAREMDAAAAEYMKVRDQNEALQQTFGGGEPVIQTAERLAVAEQLTVAAVQSVGTEKVGSFQDALASIRISGAALGPLRRFMNSLETSRNGLVIRELTIRKSVGNAARLDAEIIVATLGTIPDPGK